MRLVLIEWLDSYGCSTNWQELADCNPDVLKCQSVGWLLYDGDECKVIVPHLSEHGHANTAPQGCGDMAIPTQAVVRIVDLKS